MLFPQYDTQASFLPSPPPPESDQVLSPLPLPSVPCFFPGMHRASSPPTITCCVRKPTASFPSFRLFFKNPFAPFSFPPSPPPLVPPFFVHPLPFQYGPRYTTVVSWLPPPPNVKIVPSYVPPSLYFSSVELEVPVIDNTWGILDVVR